MGSNTKLLNTSGGAVASQSALTEQKQNQEWPKEQKLGIKYLELEFTRKLARYLPSRAVVRPEDKPQVHGGNLPDNAQCKLNYLQLQVVTVANF